MAIFPGANVGAKIEPKTAASGAAVTKRTLVGWVGGYRPTYTDDSTGEEVPGDTTQYRIAVAGSGETNAGRAYLGVSADYVAYGLGDRDRRFTNASSRAAYLARATMDNASYGGGVARGWRMDFNNYTTGDNRPHPLLFAPTSRQLGAFLLGGVSAQLPQLFVDSIVGATINFDSYLYDGLSYIAMPGSPVSIVEHRFFLVDAAGAAYNFPTADKSANGQKGIVWSGGYLDDDYNINRDRMPWMEGIVGGGGSVILGPTTAVDNLRLKVLAVEVSPAVPDLPDSMHSRTITVSGSVGLVDVPTYSKNGLEIVHGLVVLLNERESSVLDGKWTVDNVPEFELVDARRLNKVMYRVVLSRKHAFSA